MGQVWPEKSVEYICIDMKKQLKKWSLRIMATMLVIATLLLVIILNPILTYANKSVHNNYTIYHQQPLPVSLTKTLNSATAVLQTCELYDSTFKIDICLNDGSVYPGLISKFRGSAFAWGFYNKIVLQGNADYDNNYVALNGYKWNLTQLLVHEAVHCLQYNHLGFFKSNPIAGIAEWKWEGYAEYIARGYAARQSLTTNIKNYIESNDMDWCIYFDDNTITPKDYFKYWLLVTYCIDIKKMSYKELLTDTKSEGDINTEMLKFFKD